MSFRVNVCVCHQEIFDEITAEDLRPLWNYSIESFNSKLKQVLQLSIQVSEQEKKLATV